MSGSRKSLVALARFVVCGLLLAWIFHVIFCNEAQLFLASTGDSWESLTKWEQRSLAWSRGPRELWGMARRLDAMSTGLALAQCGLLVFLGGVRWRYVMRVQGLDLSLRQTTQISLVAHFFNAFLLGSTGGDVIKAYYAARTTHHKKAEAVLSVFVDRLIGIFALLVFAVALMPFNWNLLVSYKRYALLSAVIVAMLVAAGGLVVVGFYTDMLGHEGPFARAVRRLPKGESLVHALSACRLFGRHRGFVPTMAALSLAVNLLVVGTFSALAHGLGLAVPPATLWLVVPMVVCLAAIPITPSGLGVRENLFVVLLAIEAFQIKHAEALSLSLLGYTATLLWSVVGGAVYLFLPERTALKSDTATAVD